MSKIFPLILIFTVFGSIGVCQVGIGTASPSEALDIEVDTTLEMAISINNTGGGDPMIHFQTASTTRITLGVDNSDSDKLKFGSTAPETGTAITILNSGDVGINDDNPAYKLEVDGNANTTNSIGVYRIGADHALSKPNTKNIYIGEGAGAQNNVAGTDNVYAGFQAGYSSTSGDYNISIGNEAGYNSTSGGQNTVFGYQAGYSSSTAQGTIKLGYQTGYGATASNILFIDNSSSATPLIYGDFSTDELTVNGGLVINEQGADEDFRVESQSFTAMLQVDAANDYLYVGSDNNVITRTVQVNGSGNSSVAVTRHSSDADGPVFSNVKGRGTEASPTIVSNDDVLGPIKFAAYDGLDFNHTGATIEAKVNGTAGANDMPTEFRFQTTPDGSVTQQIRMVIEANGTVGINETSPQSPLHVEESGATVATFNRLTDDGTLIDFQVNGTSEGSVSVSGATVSYNAFTGGHYAYAQDTFKYGAVMVLNGNNKRLHNNTNSELLYGIEYSSKPNQKTVLGAYSSLINPSDSCSVDNPHQVMAVGNGKMWVTNEGGKIKKGDYLITSSTKGMAMKDNGDFPVSYVCARSAENINWYKVKADENGVKKVLLNVFYESFTIENDIQKKIDVLRSQVEALKELTKDKRSI